MIAAALALLSWSWAVLQPALVLYVALWFLWVLFAAIMRIKMVRDTVGLPPGMKPFAYTTLAVGWPFDVFINLVVFSFLLWEKPRVFMKTKWGLTFPWPELTVSARVWRWSNDATGAWRFRLCLRLRQQLLDLLDPKGVHRG